jgi:hypothetical protein
MKRKRPKSSILQDEMAVDDDEEVQSQPKSLPELETHSSVRAQDPPASVRQKARLRQEPLSSNYGQIGDDSFQIQESIHSEEEEEDPDDDDTEEGGSIDSGFAGAEKVWCGVDPPKQEKKSQKESLRELKNSLQEAREQQRVERRNTQQQEGGSDEDGGAGGNDDEVMFVSTDDADADVVVQRAGHGDEDDAMRQIGESWRLAAEMKQKEFKQGPIVWADDLADRGWDGDWNPLIFDENNTMITKPAAKKKRKDAEWEETDSEGEEEERKEGKDEDEDGDHDRSEYHWGVTSEEADPGGVQEPWVERVAEKVYNTTRMPFMLIEEGKVYVPKPRELVFPPDPTPGVPPEQGGAVWLWEEHDDDKGIYKGAWRFNRTVDPVNGYDYDELMAYKKLWEMPIIPNLSFFRPESSQDESEEGGGGGGVEYEYRFADNETAHYGSGQDKASHHSRNVEKITALQHAGTTGDHHVRMQTQGGGGSDHEHGGNHRGASPRAKKKKLLMHKDSESGNSNRAQSGDGDHGQAGQDGHDVDMHDDMLHDEIIEEKKHESSEFECIEASTESEEQFEVFRQYMDQVFKSHDDSVIYETDPKLIQYAEDELYPGTKTWLEQGPRIEYHADRPDAHLYPESGPPLSVIQAEQDEGGRSAVYLNNEQRERIEELELAQNTHVFEPFVWDIRPALAESGTNITTWEECLELGYIPGYPRIPTELRWMQDSGYWDNAHATINQRRTGDVGTAQAEPSLLQAVAGKSAKIGGKKGTSSVQTSEEVIVSGGSAGYGSDPSGRSSKDSGSHSAGTTAFTDTRQDQSEGFINPYASTLSPFSPPEPADDGLFGVPRLPPSSMYFPRNFLLQKYRQTQVHNRSVIRLNVTQTMDEWERTGEIPVVYESRKYLDAIVSSKNNGQTDGQDVDESRPKKLRNAHTDKEMRDHDGHAVGTRREGAPNAETHTSPAKNILKSAKQSAHKASKTTKDAQESAAMRTDGARKGGATYEDEVSGTGPVPQTQTQTQTQTSSMHIKGVKCMSMEMKMFWCWIYVEDRMAEMMQSDDAIVRDIGAGLKASAGEV